MSAEHQKQIDAGVRFSLTQAGIGKEFHDRSLHGVGAASAIREWFLAEGRAHFARGLGVIVHGQGPISRDCFVLTARAVHLASIGVMVTSLPRLLDAMETRFEEYVDRATGCNALFLTEFYEPMAETDPCPYSPREMRMLADLIERRLDDQKSVSVYATALVGRATKWYPARMLNRLSVLTKHFEVTA